MKTNFWKSAAAFVVGMAAMVACQKEQLTPVFPQEVITNSDVTTTSESITFTANLDWELSVPQETIAFFWLEDESGNKLNKLSGKAGKVTVKVGITDEPDFNNDITCDVTLKMGEESKVVATYTLLKSVKEFKAFANELTNGNLAWNTEEGGFLYEEQPTTEVTLVYNETYGFVMPFKFEAGFNYDVECPEWMNVTASALSENAVGKRGVSLVEVSANLEKLTAEDTAGDLKIKVRNSDEVVATIKVNMPSLADFILCSKSAVTIGIDGKYLGELDACELTVQTGVEKVFVLVGKNKNGYWGTSLYGEYQVATLTSKEPVVNGPLTSYKLSVEFTANEGAPRYAYLLALTEEKAGLLEQWTFMDGAENEDTLPELLLQDIITTFTQEGVKELFTVEGAQCEKMPTYSDFYLAIAEKYGEIPAYIISATKEFAILSNEISGYALYNDGFELTNDLFKFTLVEGDPIQFKFSATEETYGFIELQKVEYVDGQEEPIVTPLAVLWVEYYPSNEPVVEGDAIAFAYPTAVSGATLVKFSESGLNIDNLTDLKYSGVALDNIYVLTYNTEWPSMASITVPCLPDWGASYGNADSSPSWWLTYEEDEGFENQIYVLMSQVGQMDFFTFGQTGYALLCTRTN